MGQKLGGCCASFGGAGFLSNTMWLGPRSTSTPSGILIHPTVWPQYTNIIDREDGHDRQRSDRIGRTVLQTVAQKQRPVVVGQKSTVYGQTRSRPTYRLTESMSIILHNIDDKTVRIGESGICVVSPSWNSCIRVLLLRRMQGCRYLETSGQFALETVQVCWR